MEYTHLGRSGLLVSKLCLGTMAFGNSCDETGKRTLEQLKRYDAFCKDLGVTQEEASLAWLLHNPCVTCPIIGVSKAEQIESSAKALEVKLTAENLKQLDEIFPAMGAAPEAYAWQKRVSISTYNVIIMRSFFASLPESLEEAALIDGANEGQILRHVILPLSKPVLAVIALYYAVGHWNSWFPSMVFIRNTKLYTLQYVLRGILITNSTSVASGDNVLSVQEISFASELVKYCTIVISTLPIMCVYPFLTKYFEKGVMIGAVKG